MKYIYAILFFGFSLPVQAQVNRSAKIEGSVTTSDGKPVEAVSVSLKGTSLGASTNTKGQYLIKNVRPGNYTLVATGVTIKRQEKNVSVQNGQTAAVNFTLDVSAQDLQEVTVNGSKTNKFAVKESDYVSKMPLKNLENPQVYNSVSKEILNEQLVFSVDDATRNVPGLQKMWDATGRGGDGGAYYSSRGFVTSSSLRNGISGLVTAGIDAINLEKLEVLKGPSGTLFGSTLTSYGATINRVTKKPYENFGGEISASAGNFDFHRFSVDINTPVTKDKKLLFRLNSAYNYQGGFQQNIFARNLAVAPSLQYKPNDRLTINLDAELAYGKNTGNQIFFFYFPTATLGITSADKVNVDYRNSLMGDGLTQQSRNTNFFGQVNYKISEHFTSSTNFASSKSFSNGYSPYFYLIPDTTVTHNPADLGKSNYVTRADQSTRNSKSYYIEAQQNFNGDFQIGSLRNRVVLGLDFLLLNPTINFYGIDPFDVVPTRGADYSGFNGTALDARYAAIANPTPYISNVKTRTYSAYVSDVLNLTDNLMALAALRVDRFDNKGGLTYSPVDPYKQTAFSPKFGLVYQPLKDRVSLFANYQNSFKNLGYYNAFDPSSTNTQLPILPALAKAEQANQIEGGIKLDILDGKISSTISYYDIEVKNTLRADLRAPAVAQIQNGMKVSRGIDFELMANPVKEFNALIGFSYNENHFKNASADVDGLRDAYSMAPYTANFWLSYRFINNGIKGLGFGFGGNYASDNKVVNNRLSGEFVLPAYTVLNASAFYDIKKARISAKVDNLTNEKYWIGYGTMNPQRPTNFAVSLAYKF